MSNAVKEQAFVGGNFSHATRVGDTVRRRSGPWTPAVHSLLRFLEAKGFEAPRALGTDEKGREILGYVEGETHTGWPEPMPGWVTDDERLADSARLLRRYHDVIASYPPPADSSWRLVAPTSHDLICHNDWAPYNALFRHRRIAVMLDWDSAGPGSRLWDLTSAAYSWVPLSSGDKRAEPRERARRLRLYCDAYGLDDRSEVISTTGLRLEYVARFFEEEAGRGDPGFAKLVSWDVPARLRREAAWLGEHRALFERTLA